MTAPTRVMLADPQGDRFPLRGTLLVVACCALAGALGARAWLIDGAAAPSSHRTAELATHPSGSPRPEAAPAPKPPAPKLPAAHGTAAVSRARTRSFEPGVVAYLRCDGAERPDARYPCPRDRVLEAEVWRVLGDLTKCPDADPGSGSGELRLAWSKAGAMAVDVRSEPGQHLNAAAVSKCVGDRLRALRSSVRADRGIAAFHFELR